MKMRFCFEELSDEGKKQSSSAQAMKILDRGNSAVTLLEIAVVIGIIAVLAAFLIPALSRSREQAKATVCANNVRQLLAGRQSYVVENDGGTIPGLTTWSGAACTWRWYLNQKYEIPTKAFHCPSAPSIQHDTAENDLDSNYAALGDSPWNNSVSVASIEYGSQQLVLIETRGDKCVLLRTDWKTTMGDGKGIIGYWHNYKTTCGYADGHIELKKLGQTVTPVCEWDTTTKGIYNGQTDSGTSSLYSQMPSSYK